MMRDRIWLSLDLGPGPDRQALYAWLAAHQARECGPGLVTLFYEYQDDLADELKDELADVIHLAAGERVYLIYKDPDDGEVTGVFLFGLRAGKNDVAALPAAINRLS